MAWYTSWFGTRYYKLLYGHRDEEEARLWVDGLRQRMGLLKGDRLLDLACGRGRHARWFADAGMQVTGIDISSESICEARNAVCQAEFHVHDMRLPFGSERFDAAVCLFTSLGYSASKDDDRNTLRNVVDALRPGGHFVVDFMNTHRILRDLVPEESVEVEGVRFRITRRLEEGRIFKRIEVTDHDRKEVFEERVLALLPSELEEMLIQAGLSVVDRTCGPPFEVYQENVSDRIVLWAIKDR